MNKILFITLSNIGDVVLTLPVLDLLKDRFPHAKVTVVSGPRAEEIFRNNPAIFELFIYDKRADLKEKFRLFSALKKQKFDMVVDLRNTFMSLFISAKYKTRAFLAMPKNIRHMKDMHLYRIKPIISKLKAGELVCVAPGALHVSLQDEIYVDKELEKNNIPPKSKIVVVAPGARSHTKRWPEDKFLSLAALIAQDCAARIVLVGDNADAAITNNIARKMKNQALDLAGKTNLSQLACLLKKSVLAVTNDSAVMHIASYLNVPVVAIFGISDEHKYGPWSQKSAVIKQDLPCRPCAEAQCRFGTLECIQSIKVQDVFAAASNILGCGLENKYLIPGHNFERILIVRTDRIGDVLLSTPVIKALRENYPRAHIAMMVSPYAKDIVDGNPYLDEVIIYDKDSAHRSWIASMNFAGDLRKKKFDLTLILHPTNRAHLLAFFSGIPRRVGYDRKLGFLLTDQIEHTKQLGAKHELEYSLDLVRRLGIEPRDKSLFMPIKLESEKWVSELFVREKIAQTDKLLAIHPGASCPSKVWPNERFAWVADKLIAKYKFKALIVAGPKDIGLARNVAENMHEPVINLAGETSLSQLASLLKRCRLFISNDSGPVHIASAVGTPVISIFGRNQPGLSPVRWGPLGLKDRFLHKETGCLQCLAHNCVKEFACLKAISVEDVLSAADALLNESK